MAALAAVTILGGCSAAERLHQTDFRPQADGSFIYRVKVPVFSDSSAESTAEKERIAWLEEYLADNALCLDGYALDGRRTLVIAEVLFGAAHSIFYTVRCAP